MVESSSCVSEIRCWMALAYSALGRLSNVWRSTVISTTLKFRLLNALVIPIFLYGNEAWTLTAASCALIDAFHRRCLRRVLGVRWFHFLNNDRLYALAGHPTKLTTIIRRGRVRLLGHIMRTEQDTPARRVLTAASHSRAPQGWRRPRGHPRLTWVSQVSSVVPLNDAAHFEQDRRAFREFVATVT